MKGSLPMDEEAAYVRIVDSIPPDTKKQRHGVAKDDVPLNSMGSLPSKEQMASKGLEAKVDMATYGQTSWALTSLGAWRHKSLATGNSAQFVKYRQREARRAFLRAGVSTTGGGAGVTPRGRESAKPPEGESGGGEMVVDEAS